MTHVPLQIEKVLELDGAHNPTFNAPAPVFAHISKPIKPEGRTNQDELFAQQPIFVQYAILATNPQNEVMRLGEIDPETRAFEEYDPDGPAPYTRAGNHVVNQVYVPPGQMSRLKTLDEVLEIEGISIIRELFPGDKDLVPEAFMTARVLQGRIERFDGDCGYVEIIEGRPVDGFELQNPQIPVGTVVDCVYLGYNPEDKPEGKPRTAVEDCPTAEGWVPNILIGIRLREDVQGVPNRVYFDYSANENLDKALAEHNLELHEFLITKKEELDKAMRLIRGEE